MKKEIIESLKLLGSNIEYLDEESVNDYLDEHSDEKQEIKDIINHLEQILTWV